MTPILSANWKNPAASAILPNRVLVLDAEPLIQWAICTALAQAGYDPVAVRTGEEARRAAAEWPPPRVAVLAIDPCEESSRLIDDLRRLYGDCRFVVLSTDPRHAVAWRAPACASRVSFVTKPFDIPEILRLVADVAAAEEKP